MSRPVTPTPTWPDHLGGTRAEWRRMKRRELDEVISLIEDRLLVGAAYLPDGRAVGDVLNTLRFLRETMQVKVWK